MMGWLFGNKHKPRCDLAKWAKIIAEKEREAAEAKMAREKAQSDLLDLFATLTEMKDRDNAPDD